jgi:hypothetical protein
MTEEEWLTGTEPGPLLEFLRPTAGERKSRLCAVAWARSFVRHAAQTERGQLHLPWLAAREAMAQLKAAERYAVGRIDGHALRAARQVSGGPHNLYLRTANVSGFSLAGVCWSLRLAWREFIGPSLEEPCRILREIFGNPFRPVTLDPTWLGWNGGLVPALAKEIDEGGFDRLPILADALEDAGCTDRAILDHCRQESEHVRGCWVVDSILGLS